MTAKKAVAVPERRNGTLGVRLSFRSTKENLDKLVQMAKSRKWQNAAGKPNISQVLNFIISKFESKEKRSHG